MKRMIFIIMILLIIIKANLNAQPPSLWETFTMGEGLASNRVNVIYEANDFSLWFGTDDGGVSWYHDGIWTPFTSQDGLSNNSIQSIYEASNGALWFGTNGAGLSQKHNEMWTTITQSDSTLIDNTINTICEASDGALWFGTSQGVSRFQKEIWTSFTKDSTLADNNVHSIVEASDGALWFGTRGGVTRCQDGTWQTFTTADGLISNLINAICETSDSALWVGTDQGASLFQDGEWKINELVGKKINTICEAGDGAVWFGTDNYGVSRLKNGFWKTFTESDGLVDNTIKSICKTSDGALWFATHDGVSRYQEDLWTTFTSDDSLVDNNINIIYKSQTGVVWFGTNKGVNNYYQDNWLTLGAESGLANSWIHSIAEGADGALWFGTKGEGVTRCKNGIWKTFTITDGLADNFVNTVCAAKDSAVWFGTWKKGVSRYHHGTWTSFTKVDGLVDNQIDAICEANDGALWFGTPRGVSRFQNRRWETFTDTSGLAGNVVKTIYTTRDGAVWIGHEKEGVSRYFNHAWETLTTADGLIYNRVYAIYQSSDGALWFGTKEGGVSRYQDGLWTSFTSADGLVNNSVNTIGESEDGSLWFGTPKGVSRLKPDKIPPFTFIMLGPEAIIGTATPMFNFSGKDYPKQKALLYAYEVRDADNYCVSGNSLEFFEATVVQPTLNNNGKYTFLVWARDGWGNVDPTPAKWSFQVDITPPTVAFLAPKTDEVVAGEVAIIGSAYDNSPLQDFEAYQLSYAFTTEISEETEWHLFHEADSTEIQSDTLAIWNTVGLPHGSYWLRLSAQDKLAHESQEYLQVELVKAHHSIPAGGGGSIVTALGDIKVYFPPNALPEDTQIRIKMLAPHAISIIDNPLLTFTNLCFEIAPNELHLLKPKSGTLSLTYTDSLDTFREEKLALYQSAYGQPNWRRLGGTVTPENNNISTSFKQLGVFALYEDLSTGEKTDILNLNCQPRIFSPQGGGYDTKTTISFELGTAAKVTVKIYNAAGRLVRVVQENEDLPYGNNVVFWDGKDRQGDFCVSDLYIVTVQAAEKMATKTVVVLNKY